MAIKKPRGILDYDVIEERDSSNERQWEWEKIGYLKSGDANGFAASSATKNTAHPIVQLSNELRGRYRRLGASWLMSDLTQATIRNMVDTTGNFTWEQSSLKAGMPNLLCGYPVYTDDFMPEIAANKFPIAFMSPVGL